MKKPIQQERVLWLEAAFSEAVEVMREQSAIIHTLMGFGAKKPRKGK